MPTFRLPSFWTVFASIPLLMATGLAGAGAWLAIRPDLVLVTHVTFVGADRAEPASLRHLASVPNGTTWWAVDTGAVKRGVEQHPWVRRATVTREWPGTVRVHLEERTPVALLALGDSAYVLDEGGVPFLRADGTALDLPIITGLDAELESQHPELPRLVLRDALWVVRSLPERTGTAPEAVSSVAFSRDIGLTVTVGRSRVLFGLEGLPRQMDRLERLVHASAVSFDRPLHVDLAPATVAIVRPLTPDQG